MSTQFTSELDAVNAMLRAIGEAPVSSLEDVRAADALIAIDVLREVTREMLLKGWSFNRDYDFPLSAQATAPFNIELPENVLSISVSACDSQWRLQERGGRIYDVGQRTFAFSPGKTLRFDIIWNTPFDETTEAFRRYVTIVAARRFQDDTVGDQAQNAYKQRDEVMARAALSRDERRRAPRGVLKNITALSILNRRPRPY
ncbi:MAG: hypothetical protein HRU14_15800 [Planctomycetes bacterium]|nr:hypothetical protein [Planctomycetota bacterium]